MSLIKYTVFINSLIVNLKNSGNCCSIYRTPSTIVGYADDLAACTCAKKSMDNVLQLVENNGRTCRYNFNAKKSEILVYGESKASNKQNALRRVFNLGPDRVGERINYDHVGVKACLYDDDTTGLEERLSKARRAFYSISGIGIRRKGLNMAICSVIFWSIVVPIAMYGCELLMLSDKSIAILENFQEHIGKRIQRLSKFAPKVFSCYTLGWIRLERLVEVKKNLLIRSILCLKEDVCVRIIFCTRASYFFDNYDEIKDAYSISPVFDLIKTAMAFGLIDYVKNFIRYGCYISKAKWRDLVWRRAWDLEKTYRLIQCNAHRSLEYINKLCSSPMYLCWWYISDNNSNLIGICENMACVVCRGSRLKCDDVRLKSLTNSWRWCELCDFSVEEDLWHCIMQCPAFQDIRIRMFNDVESIFAKDGQMLQESGYANWYGDTRCIT